MSEYVVGTDGHEGHWFTGETIIRCRDCKNRFTTNMWSCEKHEIVPTYFCQRENGLVLFEVALNDFCAWGEVVSE